MKKILCFMLSFMLLFNTTVVYADIGGDIPTPFPTLIPTFPDPGEFFIRLLLPDGGQAADYISEWLKKRWSTDEDKSKDMSSDGNTVTFNSNFVDELNTALQDKIHALDGYYLVDPSYSKADLPSMIYGYNSFSDDDKQYLQQVFNSYDSILMNKADFKNSTVFSLRCLSLSDICYIYSGSFAGSTTAISTNITNDKDYKGCVWVGLQCFRLPCMITDKINPNSKAAFSFSSLQKGDTVVFGAPFKVFYSYNDAQKYLNNGKQRTYIPKLPSGGFKVNIKYINNTTNLPDITYNITTENKTETEIQNQYDTTINNYLNGLDDFTDGGGDTTNPTPTPSGGGSGGDFGDGTTPTPKPDFSDGSLTDTNTLLQKILDKLTEFSANHDKLAKTITDYIEKNDGKLEEILLAIQALSDGKTETEQNGCKYDFTALSKYLTTLWNDSDKKFDEMVKLLEENNKYQQKLVDSLNEIKALLIADTVMDFFKDRSQETAEKAKDKFPTSIPWDVSLVLNSMSAEPKNPKFSLPIKIESFKINETIDIDLSTDEWEKLAKTCRYILSVTFILFLIHLSRKLFSSGGDD